MIDEKKIELMKKLQRLAERGVGGEKEGAQKKLQQLMKNTTLKKVIYQMTSWKTMNGNITTTLNCACCDRQYTKS